MKSKGERERHIQLNADFQRTAQRGKKVFFNEHCIKLEENNRRGKTRELVRKIGDINGMVCTVSTKVSAVNNINSRELVDAEEIKKRWKEYMEELYKRS